MPSVTYNAQSFAVDGRRTWIVGADLQYARCVPEQWAERIAAAAQAGFNTIAAACPWSLHEPRKGRYVFQGQADVGQFVSLCGEAGMHVVLRCGPYVGNGFDGGGLPSWLAELPDIVLREINEAYLERSLKYLRKLVGEVSALQASQGGPLILVQAEHGWNCSNRPVEEKYLHETVRILRESGIDVPIINANDLWPDSHGTIDTWRGSAQMLRHVRQLRTVQPDAPRIVSELAPVEPSVWGEPLAEDRTPAMAMRLLGEVLAAGGQPIVTPFHGGTNFGFTGGRIPGAAGRLVTTAAAPAAALGEAGARTRTYRALKRLATFASGFGHVMAELDPDYQPVTLDPTGPGSGEGVKTRGLSVVPLRGSLGRIVFVFSEGRTRHATLLLDNGVHMPIDLGDQLVGWYALGVDLLGLGRLDYANLCPVAMVGRSTVILQGPEKSPVYLSVGGTPLQEQVPGGKKPLVVRHKTVTFVICNQNQVDVTYHDGQTVYVGIAGFDLEGRPIPAATFGQATIIDEGGEVTSKSVGGSARKKAAAAKSRSTSTAIKFEEWRAAPAVPQVEGRSPRYATLDGPQTLAASGAGSGYGWYRIELKASKAGKHLCHLPQAGDRVHLYLNGEAQTLFGVGPGAEPGPFELKLKKGANMLVALVDNYGRFDGGNDLLDHKGLFGHLQVVKAMTTTRPKKVEAEPVSAFELRGFILGLATGQLSDGEQASWTFAHSRRTPILVDVVGATVSGTFVLNDTPIAYYAGATGACMMRLMLDPKTLDPFKRGKNELRFAPDLHQDQAVREIGRHTHLYECVEALSDGAKWGFAKWEPPSEGALESLTRTRVRELRGRPVWWKTRFEAKPGAVPLWLDTSGLSKGQVYLNDENLGRFFTAGVDGRPVGPQQRLYLPASWLREDGPNDLVVFDEHGFDPHKAAIVAGPASDLEQV